VNWSIRAALMKAATQLATDERRLTPIEQDRFIRVHRRSSVAQNRFVGSFRHSVGAVLAAAVFLLFPACGYHVSGKANLLPKNIHTIYVPAFENLTTHYRLTDAIPEAISREFIARTRYEVVRHQEDADAVLKGSVTSLLSYAILTDQSTGRATALQVVARLQVNLYDRSGKVLYSRPSWEFHQRYELSTNAQTYFDESGAAELRMSQDVAREVVSGILENF
jgi:Lipopolysaccharide-assembly